MSAAIIIRRRPDWALRLDALVCSRLHAPFAWGVNDCALFAADAVLAVTGHDLAAGLRGLGARAALRQIQRAGGLCQLVPDSLPLLRSVADAQEGDVALIEQPAKGLRGLALGVVLQVPHAGVAGPARKGLAIAPLSAAIQAWGVGHG